ncbi:PTS N-acetylgalactosamine transporter subunit IIB [Oceanivirga miroungae]|uniref:PTS system mannose/fructose/sorbose family transporter subunit IIB n=1 Tax=Oceanivirga miroungae TaxID=1130046 RepID=A0A6I8MEY3_9FUSO|nr:PTS N-acetylgalactosamine transporter subunit IIB [Oceanivirga miroungae]VWL85665.1 PTS system mannose/fructose/sorbose family transporter subunit IIB [Oceanivirga miroungae]
MANILAARIDNRLVHGQVGMTWVNSLNANLILVANDAVSNDPVQQSLMSMVVPAGVAMRFFSIEKTLSVIGKAADRQKILLVCKTPQDVLRLTEGGLVLPEWIVGNMHFSEGKKQIRPTVSVDEDDVNTLKKLHELGVKLTIKGVPTDSGEDIMKLI